RLLRLRNFVAYNAWGCFSFSGNGERFSCAARVRAAQTRRSGALAQLYFLRKVMGAQRVYLPSALVATTVRESSGVDVVQDCGRMTSNSEIMHLAGKGGFRRSDRNYTKQKLQLQNTM